MPGLGPGERYGWGVNSDCDAVRSLKEGRSKYSAEPTPSDAQPSRLRPSNTPKPFQPMTSATTPPTPWADHLRRARSRAAAPASDELADRPTDRPRGRGGGGSRRRPEVSWPASVAPMCAPALCARREAPWSSTSVSLVVASRVRAACAARRRPTNDDPPTQGLRRQKALCVRGLRSKRSLRTWSTAAQELGLRRCPPWPSNTDLSIARSRRTSWSSPSCGLLGACAGTLRAAGCETPAARLDLDAGRNCTNLHMDP